MTGIVAQNVARTSGLIKAASGGGGVWTLIKTLTASDSGTLDFVDGTDDVVLDSTYPIYVFKFINIHPRTNTVQFQMNVSIDGGSNYNVTKTTTNFIAYHFEADDGAALNTRSAYDLAQSTAYQILTVESGNEADMSINGNLQLFDPSSTTFVKHFIYVGNSSYLSTTPASINDFVAGYANTTSAVDAINFKMSDGNFDGKIKLYGLSDS